MAWKAKSPSAITYYRDEHNLFRPTLSFSQGEKVAAGRMRADPAHREVAIDFRNTRKLMKQLEEQRHAAVEQLKHAAYFHRQIAWLQDRFPDAEMQAVPGLVKVVTRKEIADADWNLTPGRYVGVTASEVDEDFDFEQAITDIHTELAALSSAFAPSRAFEWKAYLWSRHFRMVSISDSGS